MEKNQVKAIGVALAELESAAIARVGYNKVKDSLNLMGETIDQLAPQEIYFLCLSYFIHMLELASSPDEVEYILQMAERRELCREVIDIGEINKYKGDLSKRGLLAYIGDSTWIPSDFANKTHQALMLSAKNALGRIRRDRDFGGHRREDD